MACSTGGCSPYHLGDGLASGGFSLLGSLAGSFVNGNPNHYFGVGGPLTDFRNSKGDIVRVNDGLNGTFSVTQEDFEIATFFSENIDRNGNTSQDIVDEYMSFFNRTRNFENASLSSIFDYIFSKPKVWDPTTPLGSTPLAVEYIGGIGVKTFKLTTKELLRRTSMLNSLLRLYRGKTWSISGINFRLTADKMRHILQRHHPKYWDGSTKTVQSFLPESWTTKTVENAISHVLHKNSELIGTISKTRTKFQIHGNYLGRKITIGFNNGKIGQFYTH